MIGAAVTRSPAAPFLAVCALLLVVTAVEWLPSGARPASLPQPRPGHATQAAKADDARDTADWSDTVLERPLFAIGRRPPKAVSAGHLANGAGLPRLAGIMVSPFGKRAIFMPDTGKAMTLAEGAAVNENTIRSISNTQVILTGPKGDTVLSPTLDKQRSATGPASGTSSFLQGTQPPAFMPPGQFQTGFQPPPAPLGEDNADNDEAPATNQPPQPRPPFLRPGMPGMRGPMAPHGRPE